MPLCAPWKKLHNYVVQKRRQIHLISDDTNVDHIACHSILVIFIIQLELLGLSFVPYDYRGRQSPKR
jgi:hypothetical protein